MIHPIIVGVFKWTTCFKLTRWEPRDLPLRAGMGAKGLVFACSKHSFLKAVVVREPLILVMHIITWWHYTNLILKQQCSSCWWKHWNRLSFFRSFFLYFHTSYNRKWEKQGKYWAYTLRKLIYNDQSLPPNHFPNDWQSGHLLLCKSPPAPGQTCVATKIWSGWDVGLRER